MVHKLSNQVSLAFLVSAMMFTRSESLNFTQHSPTKITVHRGGKVSLYWNFKLEPGEIRSKVMCHFQNTTKGTKMIIAHKVPFRPAKGFPKVKTHGKNYAVQVSNIDYQESGKYFLEVFIYKTKGQNINTSSPMTFIKVEGEPVFDEKIPNGIISRKEKESLSVVVNMRASPRPVLCLAWNYNETTELDFALVNGFYNRFTANFILLSLNRNQCGKNVTYYGKNKYGRSTTQTITVKVLFKPIKAQNVIVRYAHNGIGVQVNWTKQESGLCDVQYHVDFLNSTKHIIAIRGGTNILSAYAPNQARNYIVAVVITAFAPGGSSKESYQVFSTTNPTPGKRKVSRDDVIWIIFGLICGVILLIAVIIFTTACQNRSNHERL